MTVTFLVNLILPGKSEHVSSSKVTGAEVTGAGTGAEVAGAGTGAEVTGAETGAEVTGAEGTGYYKNEMRSEVHRY